MAELIQKRYGTALFELAVENNLIEQIEKEVLQLKVILTEEKELLEILSHPQISMSNKKKLIEDVFKDQISDELMGLIHVTIQKGRQGFLVRIMDDFIGKVNDYHGILTVDVHVSQMLSEMQRNQLVEKLEGITQKTVLLKEHLDETLIGGMVVRIGDRIVDTSVKARISKMSRLMMN